MPHQTITAAELHRILENPTPDRVLPNGRISLRNLKFGSETGVHKCDLHSLNFNLSNCDLRDAMLTTDNLKQLKKMRASGHVPMHNDRIDIRGALITENQRMFKSSRSIIIDNDFSYEMNHSITFFRQKRGLPNLPALAVPAAVQLVQPQPQGAPQVPAVAQIPAVAVNVNAAQEQRSTKRYRQGG